MAQLESGSPSDELTVAHVGADDSARMRHALALAVRGWGQTAPNPLVGAVVVQGGSVVGEGFHARFGGDHAEVVALRAAGNRAQNAELHVTLEPCNHHGQTPPCSDAIIAAGIKRVVIAVPDPNPAAKGGLEKLRAAGLEVVVGVEPSDATELNAAYIHKFSSLRPWVTLKLAMTLDGAIADSLGSSTWITGVESRAEVHRMRAGNDAVAVGMNTLIQDNPMLSARTVPEPRRQPARVIFGQAANMPDSSKLVQTARDFPTYLVTKGEETATLAAVRRNGINVIVTTSLEDSLLELRTRGIDSILVEGGAGLASGFLDGGLVDRMVIFQAPTLMGNGGLNAFSGMGRRVLSDAVKLHVLKRQSFGADQMTVYAFAKS